MGASSILSFGPCAERFNLPGPVSSRDVDNEKRSAFYGMLIYFEGLSVVLLLSRNENDSSHRDGGDPGVGHKSVKHLHKRGKKKNTGVAASNVLGGENGGSKI